MLNMTKKYAGEIVGGISKTSKMGCKSYGLPAAECKTGSKLRLVAGSTCSDCYALKGNYTRYPAVIAAQYKRLAALSNPSWVQAMAVLIGSDTHFRFHDSGDLQSIEHLELICELARALPNCLIWIPTREKAIVKRHAEKYAIPGNLVIRLSAAMIDGAAPAAANTSTVHTNVFGVIGFECTAPANNGECGDCRACWDTDVKNVSYKQH